jgi:hypothetical protein
MESGNNGKMKEPKKQEEIMSEVKTENLSGRTATYPL